MVIQSQLVLNREQREALNLTVNDLQARKTVLIGALRANKKCPWSEGELRVKNVRELEQLAILGGMIAAPEGPIPPPPVPFARKKVA